MTSGSIAHIICSDLCTIAAASCGAAASRLTCFLADGQSPRLQSCARGVRVSPIHFRQCHSAAVTSLNTCPQAEGLVGDERVTHPFAACPSAPMCCTLRSSGSLRHLCGTRSWPSSAEPVSRLQSDAILRLLLHSTKYLYQMQAGGLVGTACGGSTRRVLHRGPCSPLPLILYHRCKPSSSCCRREVSVSSELVVEVRDLGGASKNATRLATDLSEAVSKTRFLGRAERQQPTRGDVPLEAEPHAATDLLARCAPHQRVPPRLCVRRETTV